MLVAEHEAVRRQLDPLLGAAAHTGDRVGREQTDLLDQLDAGQSCSTGKISPACTARPNGQPVPSGPPASGLKYR